MMSFFIYIILLNLLLYKICFYRLNNDKRCVIILIISLFLNAFSIWLFQNILICIFINTLLSVFIFIIYTDFTNYLIFDEFNFILLCISIVYCLYSKYFGYFKTFFIVILIVICINLYMKKTGKEIIGGGDLKLFISMSLFVGGVGTIFCLTISSFFGIVYYLFNKNKLIPFGPFLSVGYFLVFLLLEFHIII